LLARLEQQVQQRTLFAPDLLDFLAHAEAPHEPANPWVMSPHA
jgi:hypothetical protein